MTTETQTTDAAQTTEGATTSPTAADTTATAAAPEQQQQQQSTEATPAAKPDDKAAPAGAPEKYEFKAPEGQTFDEAIIGQFSEVAKELNLPQDAAQKVLDKMAPAIAARQAEQISTVKAEWETQSKADKEFGGEKLQENLALAIKARDEFATPELRKLLDDTGLGNHPEVIRFFYRTGKAISEDGFVRGTKGEAPKTTAQRMYPNMNP